MNKIILCINVYTYLFSVCPLYNNSHCLSKANIVRTDNFET